jgi:hypothetical protein
VRVRRACGETGIADGGPLMVFTRALTLGRVADGSCSIWRWKRGKDVCLVCRGTVQHNRLGEEPELAAVATTLDGRGDSGHTADVCISV